MRNNLQLREISERIFSSKFGLLLLFIAIALFVGLFIVDDYGLSWDEYKDITYGDAALDAYQGSKDFRWAGANRIYYGPFYWMSVSLISSVIESIDTDIPMVDGWKYIGFITFQLAIFSFYILCTRFMKRAYAFLTTLVFSVQPILFGHAFINAKDIPFMSFFLASVALGLHAVDIFVEKFDVPGKPSLLETKPYRSKWNLLQGKWRAADRIGRIILLGLTILLILSILEFFLLNLIFLPFLQNVLRSAYDGTASEPIKSLFQSLAQDAYKTPIELYVEKLMVAYAWGRALVVLAVSIAIVFIGQRILNKGQPRRKLSEWLNDHAVVLVAGLILGLTISIRVAAPLAGMLVSVYLIAKVKQRAFVPLIYYWGMALAMAYVTWPYLWGAPVARFIESVNISTAFIQRETLFQGVLINATEMPWFYLPLMMAIKFTEPLLLLFFAGLVVSSRTFLKHKKKRLELLLLLIWGGFPLAAIILVGIPVYDNFRQFFFVIPPLIVICGIGLSKAMSLTKKWQLKSLVIVLLLLPGLIGIFTLHPYEYIYYNTLVGGVERAYKRYELDYWCTSLRESMDYINSVAAPNSSVVIAGPPSAALPFSREDIKISDTNIYGDDLDYAVGCRYAIWDPEFFPEFETVFTVARGDGILSIIKARK